MSVRTRVLAGIIEVCVMYETVVCVSAGRVCVAVSCGSVLVTISMLTVVIISVLAGILESTVVVCGGITLVSVM